MHLHLDSLSQLGRLTLAFVLTYLLGFERDLRGSPSGDRTFSLIGVGSAIIAVLAKDGNAPNALAGVITGVGFIGAGIVFRPNLTLSARRHLLDTVKDAAGPHASRTTRRWRWMHGWLRGRRGRGKGNF